MSEDMNDSIRALASELVGWSMEIGAPDRAVYDHERPAIEALTAAFDISLTDLWTTLATSPEPVLRALAAHYPGLPLDVLERMTSDPDFKVREAIAHDHRTPTKVLTLLSEDPDFWVREEVASNPSTHPDTIAQLARRESESVYARDAWRDGATSMDIVGALEEPFNVLLAVAHNPSARPEDVVVAQSAIEEVTRQAATAQDPTSGVPQTPPIRPSR